MPGIDTNRVVGFDQDQLEELTCGICRGLFDQPVDTSCCRQSYCKDCIDQWLSGHNTCPNDRKPLTSDGLTRSGRVLVNLVNKIRVNCVYSANGCPSVHTVGQDADHSKVCEFAKCSDCGLRDADSGHNCVTHLLSVNVGLNRDRDKLKRKIARVERENRDLKTSELLVTNENKKLKNDVVALAEMNDRLKRELKANRILAVKMAIIKAKGKSGSVDKRWNLPHIWEKIYLDICKSAIDGFDHTLQTNKEFVANIKARCERLIFLYDSDYEWRVSVYPSHDQADSDASVSKFIRLSFGSLVIVISLHRNFL